MQIIYRFIFSISVVYIKEELEDPAFEVKIEPALNSSLVKEELDGAALHEANALSINLLLKEDISAKDLIIEKQNQMNRTNYSMNESVVKEEPLQDDLVSK